MKVLIIILVALLLGNVSANAEPDSVFVQKLLTEFEYQRPRLERAARKKVKSLSAADSVCLIPTLLFKKGLEWDYRHLESLEDNAEWENLDISHFYIEEFIVMKDSGETVLYSIYDHLARKIRYVVEDMPYDPELIELVKNKKPKLVFRLNELFWGYFFVMENGILFYELTGGKFVFHEDVLEYMKSVFKTGCFWLTDKLPNQRQIVH